MVDKWQARYTICCRIHLTIFFSALNPYSQFRDIYTLDQVLNAPKVFGPLTKLQCCPTSDGAGCAIIASEKFVKKHGLMDQAIEIVAQEMATDSPKMLSTSAIEWAGADMTRRAAQTLFKKAGLTPNDVQVVELHDCFSANEVSTITQWPSFMALSFNPYFSTTARHL
jgi:sterol carrier protein 2